MCIRDSIIWIYVSFFFFFCLKSVVVKFCLFRGCTTAVSYTHLRAHETRHDLVCRLLLEKKICPKLLVHFSFQSNFLYVFSKSNNFQCLTSIYIYTTLSNSLHLLGICMKTRYPPNIFLRCVIFSKGTSKRGRREYLISHLICYCRMSVLHPLTPYYYNTVSYTHLTLPTKA